jgi:hypothetical protein
VPIAQYPFLAVVTFIIASTEAELAIIDRHIIAA